MKSMILGIDEVGRGPWAGPLVVGAVVLGDASLEGLTDSKKLSKKRREELDTLIRERAAGFGLGWVPAYEIDEVGLSTALKLATIRAVEQIATSYHEIIIDGTINFLADTAKGNYVTTIKKADLLVPSVSAASIIAKVARDNYMAEQDLLYPEYKFKSHVGYGTAAHRAAIERYGVTPLHRLSFAPLAGYRSGEMSEPHSDLSVIRTTKQIGDEAEDLVAAYLADIGHDILERNWRTKFCEVDIVSQKGETLYFTEVKYRRTDKQGDGLAAITVTKQRQMRFAAELFAARLGKKHDMLLAAASVAGAPPELQDFLELR